MKRKRSKFVAVVVMAALILTMVMPMTTEAAKKKPKIKTVELRVNGQKVNGKTITVKQGSKTKIKVVVKPGNAKKSVKWGKLSKKAKKIAYIKGSTIKAGKKNGKVKLTVKVNGKRYWLKVKVVKTLPKPSTPSTPSKPVSPSNPSTPSTPSNPSTGKTYTVTWQGIGGRVQRATYAEGTTINADSIKDTTVQSWKKSTGWYTAPNGGTRVTTFKVSETTTLYGQCVAKDPMVDWNPTFVQGNVTLLASDEVYDNDGIKTYNEIVNSYMTEGWVECGCGKVCQFKVRDHKGNTIVVDKFLYSQGTNGCYVLTNAVKSSKTVSSDWAFLDITSAVDKVSLTSCGCGNIYNTRSLTYNGSVNALYNR